MPENKNNVEMMIEVYVGEKKFDCRSDAYEGEDSCALAISSNLASPLKLRIKNGGGTLLLPPGSGAFFVLNELHTV